MPDIELLMEAWPPEVEEILGNVNVLTPELDIPLEDYARMVSEPFHVKLSALFVLRCLRRMNDAPFGNTVRGKQSS